MLHKQINPEEFVSQILERLAEDNAYNLDLSKQSFVNRIFTALAYGQESLFQDFQEMIKHNSFSELQGRSLDSFLEFFAIKRLEKETGFYQMEFLYTGLLDFKIKAGCLIKYKEKVYYVLEDVYVFRETGMPVLLKLRDTDSILTPHQNIVLDVDFLFAVTGVEFGIEKTIKEKSLEFQSFFRFLGFEEKFEANETDEELKARSLNLFQFFSSNSIEKIKKSLMCLHGVTNVLVKKEKLTTVFTLLPERLEILPILLEQANKVIVGFESNLIQIKKPLLSSFKIKNLTSQIQDPTLKDLLSNFTKSFFKTLPHNNFVFERSIFDSELERIIAQNKSAETFFDVQKVEVILEVYDECNFSKLLYRTKIRTKQTLELEHSLLNIEEIR